MKRLLFPLLAALALPTAVNAETTWLIVWHHYGLTKIEMLNMEDCKKQGEKWENSGVWGKSESRKKLKYVCLKGK